MVEHDDAIRSLIKYIVLRESFEVETASKPDEALGMLEQRDYDVIVLDLWFRDPGVWKILEYLRDSTPPRLHRVVIVTAAIHGVRHGLPENICRVLMKPFDIDDLAEAVSSCSGGN